MVFRMVFRIVLAVMAGMGRHGMDKGTSFALTRSTARGGSARRRVIWATSNI
jgi:hypothetical protein